MAFRKDNKVKNSFSKISIAQSVLVPGPELKMHECGMPKEMAAELYKPFVIRKIIERGIVKSVKSATKIADRKDLIVWEILECIMKDHPVLLLSTPTLNRLGIQAFQPKLIEGKAIQLHPLACKAFDVDFDGNEIVVYLPLGNEAVHEAQMLMLGSHNILNPANGAPITVPAQDMVLGLYYITKERPGTKGEGSKFYGMEEAQIAYNEHKVDLHAPIQVIVDDVDENGSPIRHMIQTTVGRLIFNQYVPKSVGFVNELISKESLTNVISKVVKTCGVARTAQFLDDIKNLGFDMAFKGCLSLTIEDLIIPKEKEKFINEGYSEVENVMANYSMGLITPNECYNFIINIWTKINNDLTGVLLKTIKEDEQGFNSVYMMLDSGACGSIEQIRWISGMRGLMSKPQKAGADGGQIIENPILSNFKEGLSVLEYFISTHDARKGLADTALKTADAGYLTRRLIDVSHDVIINEEDCGTLRGLVCIDIKKTDDVIAKLGDRILGRVSVHDVVNPETGEVIVMAGQEIREDQVDAINAAKIEKVEIRSVLTCESKRGVCAKCYGRNLATGRMVQEGEAVGVIAAQTIGESGTQLTLRTFQAGWIETGYDSYELKSKYDGVIEFEELKAVDTTDENDQPVQVVVGRLCEAKILNPSTKIELTRVEIPYGSKLFFKQGQKVKIGDTICEWNPYNVVIVTEVAGQVKLENFIKKVNYYTDRYDGHEEKTIIESGDNTKSPVCHILNENGGIEKTYRLPIGSTVVVSDGEKLKKGQLLVKLPRASREAGDITGGLPRVQELLEARDPSNPAILAEIDGVVSIGDINGEYREVSITSEFGEVKKYLVPLSKNILVVDYEYVRAGSAISEGAIRPSDILAILGPTAVQEYIVNEVQDVYRLQGLAVNDKHFEVIVRQMMRKVQISDPGDTTSLKNE